MPLLAQTLGAYPLTHEQLRSQPCCLDFASSPAIVLEVAVGAKVLHGDYVNPAILRSFASTPTTYPSFSSNVAISSFRNHATTSRRLKPCLFEAAAATGSSGRSVRRALSVSGDSRIDRSRMNSVLNR